MNRLWTLMQDDHDAIWRILDQLTGGSAIPEPDTAKQRRLARHLVSFQSAHELAEELSVWPMVRKRCPEGKELIDTALKQESELKWALNELEHISPGSQEFTQCANTVAGLNRTHLSYEQNQIWPRLEDRLTERDTAQLVRQWQVARRTTPTRPHPHLPTHPAVLRTAGRAMAMMDRARDALIRR
jgi:hemerythrin-like domain-containing protein